MKASESARGAGIDDVGAVFATQQSQSEIDLTERFAQERLLAQRLLVKNQRVGQLPEKETLLCVPRLFGAVSRSVI